MESPAARLLELLSLLQSRPHWSAPQLADRLGVTERTVRRDVTRLRDLGYPVDADVGRTGGYQLGAGGALPPLLLTDDEAVAVAMGLRGAASGGGSGSAGRGGGGGLGAWGPRPGAAPAPPGRRRCLPWRGSSGCCGLGFASG